MESRVKHRSAYIPLQANILSMIYLNSTHFVAFDPIFPQTSTCYQRWKVWFSGTCLALSTLIPFPSFLRFSWISDWLQSVESLYAPFSISFEGKDNPFQSLIVLCTERNLRKKTSTFPRRLYCCYFSKTNTSRIPSSYITIGYFGSAKNVNV